MTMFLGQTQLGLATLIFTVFLGLSSTGEGSKQELWLYTADGNALYFQTHVPNLHEFIETLPKITRYCWKGVWLFSSEVNYRTYFIYTSSSDEGGGISCTNFNMTNVKSLRHFAANDTSTDAISLYSGKDWEGEEIFVTKAKTDISTPVKSLAASGKAEWMLYEGKNFDGKSICYQVPYSNEEFNWDKVAHLNMTTIGSVFKGCDLNEIQLYKISFLS